MVQFYEPALPKRSLNDVHSIFICVFIYAYIILHYYYYEGAESKMKYIISGGVISKNPRRTNSPV